MRIEDGESVGVPRAQQSHCESEAFKSNNVNLIFHFLVGFQLLFLVTEALIEFGLSWPFRPSNDCISGILFQLGWEKAGFAYRGENQKSRWDILGSPCLSLCWGPEVGHLSAVSR